MNPLEMKNKALTVGLAVLLFTILAHSSSGTTASTASPMVNAAQNAALDFNLVNKTGYSIKALYIGASGTGDWTKEDEVLKGRTFANGQSLDIEFNPRAKAEKWDIMVTWADGSGSEEWLNLKLTEITKVTLVYDKDADKTSAIIE
jgi:hypothetical protein